MGVTAAKQKIDNSGVGSGSGRRRPSAEMSVMGPRRSRGRDADDFPRFVDFGKVEEDSGRFRAWDPPVERC